MILRRLGNKKKIAPLIINHFPQHDIYIELFMGAGGVYFYKPQAKHNFLNDIDNNIYNLWQVIREHKEELIHQIKILPLHEKLWKEYKKKEINDPILKAVIFLMYSNCGAFGRPDSLRFTPGAMDKKKIFKHIDETFIKLQDCFFMNCDFRKTLGKVNFKHGKNDKDNSFIYADPPYLGTGNNYENSFNLQDTKDLFELLVNSGIRFALSEFKNNIVIDIAKSYNLNIIEICERRTLKSRNTEILITNYKSENNIF